MFWLAWAGEPLQDLRERIISSLVTEQRDFSIAFVMERTHERVQRVMVQLSLQIPTGCSQGALHESLKLKLLANFNNLPYFQVYLHGLGSQLWTLDARLDNGVPITSARLRNKSWIRFARPLNFFSPTFCYFSPTPPPTFLQTPYNFSLIHKP